MPLFSKSSNYRSKQALNDTPHQQGAATSTATATATATASSTSSASRSTTSISDEARQSQSIQQQEQQRGSQPYAAPPNPAIDHPTYQHSSVPSRSQTTSNRYSVTYPSPSHTVHEPPSSVDDLALNTQRYQSQSAKPAEQNSVPEQKKSRGLFDRMRSSSNRDQKPPSSPSQTQSPYNNTSGLARRLSKRLDNPPVIRTQRNSLDQRLDWQSAQDSRSHLPSSQEGREEDSGLDPYLITGPDSEPQSPIPEQPQHQTVRPVIDLEPSPFPTNEEIHEQFQGLHQQQQLQPSLGQVHQQQFDVPQHSHYQLQNQGQQANNYQDSLGISHDQFRSQNPETVSQLSYEAPIEQSQERPGSVQSNGHSPTGSNNPQRSEYPNRTTSIPQGPRPLSQYTAMAPPAGASQPPRRGADSKQTLQGTQGPPDSRDGPPPGYRQQFPGNSTPTAGPGQSPLPPPNQGPDYRGGPPQRDQYTRPGGGEQGRSTPPPAPAERDVNDAYKELLQKYKKVKGLYFDKTAQVEQLQNTLANQRLSQSRTSLDDSEYMTRFQRLDGATTNLAFNIRKDWRSIPSWLAPYVNQDALKVGKQEMTAVGRACITRFLVDEIFNRSFHPGLEGELSSHLKTIEQNIRRFSPALNNQEESDALTAKVVQWRLTTLEGLKDILQSPESEEYRKQFSRVATTNLTANLINFLSEPVPAGIEDSAHMIVELAVSIAANLPLESRDIAIVYPMPGDSLQPAFMKVESGVPPLENPGLDTSSEIDASSTGSGDKEEISKDSEKDGKLRKEKPKSGGMLQAMMGGNSTGPGPKKNPQNGPDTPSEAKGKQSSEDGPQKVRFAGFVGVEVRGRQILVKSPVWTAA